LGGEWIETVLEQIAADDPRAFGMGPFGSNIKSDNYRQSGVPVIRGNNLTGGAGAPFVADDFVFLEEEKADSLKSSSCSPKDLVFVAQGTVGKVGLVPSDTGYRRFILSQNLMKVTVNPQRADPRFVFYFYRSSAGQHEIMSRANPTGVPCISKPLTSLRQFGIRLPPRVAEQTAIADILEALDDKIELNRRMKETLEGIARAIFKSWFVDFDPVRAKMEGHQPNGMSAETAALFPAAHAESALGQIPRGWQVGSVGEIAEVSSGKRPGERYREPSPAAYVPLWGGNGPMGFVSEPLIEYPIILTGRVGTLGSVFRITSPVWPSDNTLVLRPYEAMVFEFLFLQLQRVEFPSLNRGSTQPLLTQTDLKAQRFPLPPPKVLSLFRDAVRPLYLRVDAANKESKLLAELRDTLLPKLISGDVRLSVGHALPAS